MIIAGGTGSSGESKINSLVKAQMAQHPYNPNKLEEYNKQAATENLKAVVEKLVDYFLDFSVKLQGHILHPYYNQKSNLAVIPGNCKLLNQDLVDRSKFFLLLHLRRIVTTFEGSAQDYLDEVSGYNSYKVTSDQEKMNLELQDLISSCYTNTPFSKAQVDQSKTASLQTVVVDTFTRHASKFLALNNKHPLGTDRSKTVEPKFNDPTSLNPQPIAKLAEGLRTVQTLERELENAQLRVKISQDYVAIQEASNKEIRTKLLKDVVHLRDTLFRKSAEKLTDDDIYRVDYFSVQDIADESVRLLLNDKIHKVDENFRTRLKKMQDELQHANQLIKDYDQQLNSSNPAVISSLIKRVHGLLNKDNNMLWKVLQESIGPDWFQRVLTKRELNHRYHIEYEPLDSIVPELNKIVMKKNPADSSKLGTQMDTILLGYLIETFQEQKKELLKELSMKTQARTDKMTEGYDELVEGDPNFIRDESHKLAPNMPMEASPRSNRGGPTRSVSIKISESRGAAGAGVAASKIDTGKSLALKSSPKSSSNQIADDRAIFNGEDGSELSAPQLKGRFRMLLNEIHNLKSDKVGLAQNLIALQGQFKILENLVLELTEAAGVLKEGQALVNLVGKCKKLDAKILAKNNFGRILAQGKIDSIARLAIMGTMSNLSTVHKSTNTETSEYDDLAVSTNKHGATEPFRDAVSKIMKLKSRIKDNESVRSSGSKLSMSKKFSTLRENRAKQPDSPKLSLNKKVTLDSLVEEPDISPMLPESTSNNSPVRGKGPTLSQLEYAHQRNKQREQLKHESPSNPRRGSRVGPFHDITQSMEFGAPLKPNQPFNEQATGNIKVRRFESETKNQGHELSLRSNTINSKNQGSGFEEYSQTKLKRVESLSGDSDGDEQPQMIRQRMISETRTNQKQSGHKIEEKSSPLKGADRKSKTMLPKELLEPSSPGSEQIYVHKEDRSEFDSFRKLDIFMTGGVQILGARRHIIEPQAELFSGASMTEGGVAGKFDSSLATAAMRIQSGQTNPLDDPTGLIDGRRPKKRSQQFGSPLRNTPIVKMSQFEVPEVDSTDSPRLNTLSGLQARDVKLDSPSKQEHGRTKTPSSKIVMKSLASKDEKPKFSGANLKRWQEQANSSLVDDSNTSRSKRDRETDRSLAPLPEKQRAIMRQKNIVTDSVLGDRNTRDEARRNQSPSRGNEDSMERRPNSASGLHNKFYEDAYQPPQERVKTGKIGQPTSPSRSRSRGLGSGNAVRENAGLASKVITQSGNLDDSINPWGPSSNLAIGNALNNQLRPPHEEIQTDSDLERIKLTMRQQGNSARELENQNKSPAGSPFKKPTRPGAKSLSPQNSPKRPDVSIENQSLPQKSFPIPRVPRLEGLSQPKIQRTPKSELNKPKSKSPQPNEPVHSRLHKEAHERLEMRELNSGEGNVQNRNMWSDIVQKNTGVLCRFVSHCR